MITGCMESVYRARQCLVSSSLVVFLFSGVIAVALSYVGATSGMCQSPVERLTNQVCVQKALGWFVSTSVSWIS